MRTSVLVGLASGASAAVPHAYGITSSIDYNTVLPPALYNSDLNSLRPPFYPAPTSSASAAIAHSVSTSEISSATASVSSTTHKHDHTSEAARPTAPSYTTEILEKYTTIPCPTPTVVLIGTQVYTVTEATVLTIFDCDHCTVTDTVATATAPVTYTSPAAPYPTSSTSGATPLIGTAPAPVASSSTMVVSSVSSVSSVAPITPVPNTALASSVSAPAPTGTGLSPEPFQPNSGSATRLSFGSLVAALGFVVYCL